MKSLYNLYDLECEKPGSYMNEIANIKCALQEYDAIRYREARARSRNNCTLHSGEPERQTLLHEYLSAKEGWYQIFIRTGP